jgi:hypothetical protein
MAGMAPATVFVGLFGQDDFINETAVSPQWTWNPGHGDAAQPLLQAFDQRHKIPDRENMVFHERAKGLCPVHLAVNGMTQQGFPQGMKCRTKSI